MALLSNLVLLNLLALLSNFGIAQKNLSPKTRKMNGKKRFDLKVNGKARCVLNVKERSAQPCYLAPPKHIHHLPTPPHHPLLQLQRANFCAGFSGNRCCQQRRQRAVVLHVAVQVATTLTTKLQTPIMRSLQHHTLHVASFISSHHFPLTSTSSA